MDKKEFQRMMAELENNREDDADSVDARLDPK